MRDFKKNPKNPPKNKEIGPLGSKAAFNWFPGHMMKALREIQAKASLVDIVIEIRDARIPIVSSNRSLINSLGGKSRLIILNKANLANEKMNALWSEYFEKQQIPFLFVNCLDKKDLKKIVQMSKEIVESKRQVTSENYTPKVTYKFMIIGLPNTGKSTFINSIANRNATKVANKPGQTQVQLWVKVDEEVNLLDTPGVMPPQIDRDEHKTWLSIVNAIPDGLVGEEDTASYLLNHLLKNKSIELVERYKLEEVDLNFESALSKIAAIRGCLKQKGMIDYNRVYKIILQDFREGLLGRVTLEMPPKTKN